MAACFERHYRAQCTWVKYFLCHCVDRGRPTQWTGTQQQVRSHHCTRSGFLAEGNVEHLVAPTQRQHVQNSEG